MAMAITRAVFFRNQTGLARGCKLFNPRDTSKLDAVLRALEEDLVLALAGERARTLYEPDKRCPTAAFWARMEKKF
ncbi:MAG: hypothetical protein QXI85_08130 [Desulfurococcaceae archaeon]